MIFYHIVSSQRFYTIKQILQKLFTITYFVHVDLSIIQKKIKLVFYNLLPGVDIVSISDFTPPFLHETEVLEFFPGQSIPRRSFPLGFFHARFRPR